MKFITRFVSLNALALAVAAPASAQIAPTPDAPPALLWIFREEVKVGRDAAHTAHEINWAQAFAKTKIDDGFVAMSSLTGLSEVWFLSGYPSWEARQKANEAREANAPWTAENDKFWAIDADLLSRASGMMAVYRPSLSYRAGSSLAHFRYMQVNVMRVRPGRTQEFADNWTGIVAAHVRGGLDEGWAMYEVTSGGRAGTFLYFQPRKGLADLDKAGAMHGAAAYRDALGDAGRARALDTAQNVVEFTDNLLFALSPKMSVVPKAWSDADSFWAPPTPPPARPQAKK